MLRLFKKNPKGQEFESLPENVPDRLKSQFAFYDSGSIRHLSRLQLFKTIQIVAGVTIPVLSLSLPNELAARISAASLGALISAIEAYLQFRQFQQNWVRWRGSAEALRREAYLYAQKAGPYRMHPDEPPDPETILAERLEEIIADEQQTWKSMQTKSEKDTDKKS